jgi:hypothetical protein
LKAVLMGVVASIEFFWSNMANPAIAPDFPSGIPAQKMRIWRFSGLSFIFMPFLPVLRGVRQENSGKTRAGVAPGYNSGQNVPKV